MNFNFINSVKCVQLGTCSIEKIPNVCTVAAKFIYNDKIIIIDNYFNKTYDNVQSNKIVSSLVTKDYDSYQYICNSEYYISGDYFDVAKKWIKDNNKNYPIKGVLVLSVMKIYNSSPSDNAGKLTS